MWGQNAPTHPISAKLPENCQNPLMSCPRISDQGSPFEKQNTGSSLEQFCALLVIYEIFRNSGNSKWNFSGNGYVLSNLDIWDIFPTQF